MSCCGTPLTPDESDVVARLVSERLSAFVSTLRHNAFAIGLAEAQDAALLMAKGLARKPHLMRSAFKHLFSARKSEWEKFDGIFDAFWLKTNLRHRSVVSGNAGQSGAPSLRTIQDAGRNANSGQLADQIPSTDAPGEEDRAEGRMEGASRAEALLQTDFRKLSNPEDIEQAHQIAASLARAMRTRLTRRDMARKSGYRMDMRRTIHGNISHGGVPINLVMRQRKEKPLRLVVLLDSSASMSMYTGLFLRFIHGVLDEFLEAEAFLFNTHLAHVSDAMRERDPARALDRLSLMTRGTGGGTKIGECLQDFNRWHAARVLNSRSCVMIVSDGYETGDASQLGLEMAALARRCRRIVWLNPMMGWDGYAPVAAGMKAALPHIDLLAPANTLQSLADLEPYLARL
jgi:uncharacterized protein with von Willebrand factor type A (vWA) domain